MAKLDFDLDVLYSQLCVFDSNLQEPFNDWEEHHVSQGFAWREGSVSFRTIMEDGTHSVQLHINEPLGDDSNACRIIQVPFMVPENGDVEVASISDSFGFNVPKGVYSLRIFFFEPQEGQPAKVNIYLNKGESTFEIIRADEELSISGDLVVGAIPAV